MNEGNIWRLLSNKIFLNRRFPHWLKLLHIVPQRRLWYFASNLTFWLNCTAWVGFFWFPGKQIFLPAHSDCTWNTLPKYTWKIRDLGSTGGVGGHIDKIRATPPAQVENGLFLCKSELLVNLFVFCPLGDVLAQDLLTCMQKQLSFTLTELVNEKFPVSLYLALHFVDSLWNMCMQKEPPDELISWLSINPKQLSGRDRS